MNTPNPQIADEMLSAYLDDELNPDDKARVTTALESDARLRALVADLQQIRTEIRALPSHSLSTGFAERVARSCASQSGEQVSVQPAKSDFIHRRGWIVGLIATAAMVMIAIWVVGPGGVIDSSATQMVALNESTKFASSDGEEADSDAATENGAHPPREESLFLESASATRATDPGAGSQFAAPQAAPQVRLEARAFDWASQRDSVDAVLAVTLPESRLTLLARSPRFDDSQRYRASGSTETKGQETTSDIVYYSYARPEGVENNFGGLEVEEDAKLVVIEGTSAQITEAMRSLQATSTRTLSLKGDDVASSLGLPSVSMSETANRINVDAMLDGHATPTLNLATQSKGDTASPPAGDDAVTETLEREAPAEPERLAKEFRRQTPDQLGDLRQSQRRYRVLLIVGQP